MKPATPIHKTRWRGLYALTPTQLRGQALIDSVAACLAGKVAMVQYRAKPRPDRETARALVRLCRQAGVPLIINDDLELALEVGADGVHLGREDADPAAARRRAGLGPVIGVSCYNEPGRAQQAIESAASYLAFGSVFASPTKPEAAECPLELLTAARAWGRPVVAIGGITVENAGQAIRAGADMVAVISDLFEADDITARALQYNRLFETT